MHQKLNDPSIAAELLLDTMAEGVVVVDTAGCIRYWNRGMTDITGRTREDALGEDLEWLRAPDCWNSASIEAMLTEKDGAANESLQACECRMLGKDGSSIPVLANARSVRDDGGALVGVLITFTDFRAVCELREDVRALQSDDAPPESFHGLIGRGAKMLELRRLIELAAASDATTLILGETGTGKELAATAIHEQSNRRNKPFVKVNCGALSETILESELFGHVKGAFTGAYQDRVGRFEAADGGTILLDEIGEMSPAMQVKLLRVLQEREFEPVGDTETRRVDIRVIAASNCDLATESRGGQLRENLYYRLRVFPIGMPPLRERIEDVPLLVEHFVHTLSRRTGKDIKGLDAEATRAVMDYCWPGNVRELENAIEYAFVICQTDRVGLFDLPQELRRFELRREACLGQHGQGLRAPIPASASARAVADSIVRSPEQLKQLLEECNWNKAEAARRRVSFRSCVWRS